MLSVEVQTLGSADHTTVSDRAFYCNIRFIPSHYRQLNNSWDSFNTVDLQPDFSLYLSLADDYLGSRPSTMLPTQYV